MKEEEQADSNQAYSLTKEPTNRISNFRIASGMQLMIILRSLLCHAFNHWMCVSRAGNGNDNDNC